MSLQRSIHRNIYLQYSWSRFEVWLIFMKMKLSIQWSFLFKSSSIFWEKNKKQKNIYVKGHMRQLHIYIFYPCHILSKWYLFVWLYGIYAHHEPENNLTVFEHFQFAFCTSLLKWKCLHCLGDESACITVHMLYKSSLRGERGGGGGGVEVGWIVQGLEGKQQRS